MKDRINISVYDYDRVKLCDLYDSEIELRGQAFNITRRREMKDGSQTLTFSMPFVIEMKNGKSFNGGLDASKYGRARYGRNKFGAATGPGEYPNGIANFRWDFIQSEYLIRFCRNDQAEWYVIDKPSRIKKSGIYGTISCSDMSALLKTRNVYLTFDDENGIGNVSYIMNQILNGTGWTLGHVDSLIERGTESDPVERVRSMKCDGKKGALGLITTACNLFQCRPEFDTDQMKVNIYSLNNRKQILEAEVGKNLNTLSVNFDSSDICTRLYVEGEYGDYGYVGIDDVNPTGLSYLFNFDYYRSIGVFKQAHETALTTYLTNISSIKSQISANEVLLIDAEDDANIVIGQCKMVFYDEAVSLTTPKYIYGSPTTAQMALNVGDEVVVVNVNGRFRYATIETTARALIQTGDYGIAKFITKAAGTLGAKEVYIEAKEKTIAQLENKIAHTTRQDKIDAYQAEIDAIALSIAEVYAGTEDDPGLYELMDDVMKSDGLLYEISHYEGNKAVLLAQQDDIEATFIAAMGPQQLHARDPANLHPRHA